MGAGSSAAGSGVVVGICLVFLGQQFGLIDLSTLVNGILFLIAFAVVFGVVFGLLGVWLGKRYARKHSGLTAWQSKTETPAAADGSEPPAAN